MKLSAGERIAEVDIEDGRARVDGRALEFREVRSGGELRAIEIAGKVVRVRTVRLADSVLVWCSGTVVEVRRVSARGGHAAETGDLLAPMPGRLARVLVAAGETVERGQPIMALEAMKMEHVIRSPRAGKVGKLFFGEGDLVEAGAPLAEID